MIYRRLIKSLFRCILRREEMSELILFYKHHHITNGERTAVSREIICQTWRDIFATEAHFSSCCVYIHYL